MKFPEELKYSSEHEWIRVEDDLAYVGISDFAQSELGEIVFADIDTIGETINKNEVFGSLEAVKTVSDLFMPVTGKIVEVNKLLENEPALVNSDAYGKGWLIKIELSNLGELDDLLSAEAYKKQIGK